MGEIYPTLLLTRDSVLSVDVFGARVDHPPLSFASVIMIELWLVGTKLCRSARLSHPIPDELG